jgi:hypothetical protein
VPHDPPLELGEGVTVVREVLLRGGLGDAGLVTLLRLDSVDDEDEGGRCRFLSDGVLMRSLMKTVAPCLMKALRERFVD